MNNEVHLAFLIQYHQSIINKLEKGQLAYMEVSTKLNRIERKIDMLLDLEESK